MKLTDITSPAGLLSIKPAEFAGKPLDDGVMLHLLKVAGALWVHEHNNVPDAELRTMKGLGPHAGLSKGGCSTGFLDALQGTSYTPLTMLLAREHARRIRQVYDGPVDWVIGSDHAAAVYSAFVAFCFGARHDFTAKKGEKPNELQVWDRLTIGPREVVLQCEELTTTGATPDRVAEGVQRAHDHPIVWAPVNAFAVNRTGKNTYRGHPIVPLFVLDLKVWASPEECPMCEAGSERVSNPKKNWAKLTA